jgi:Putative zinc-finger
MHDRIQMTCARPIDPAVLADYWLADLPASEEAAIEEHLMGCESCAQELDQIVALAGSIRKLAREGALKMILTQEFLDRMAREGLRIREYAPDPGGSVQCTVTSQDDFLVSRLAADLRGIEQLDLALCDVRGAELQRFADIPFRATSDANVFLNYPVSIARQEPAYTLIMRLLAVAPQGERLIGEYTFNHTPSSI